MIDQEALDLAVGAARIADAMKASDVLVLQVGDVLALTEYFVIVSASNRRLVDALVDEVEAQLKVATDRTRVGALVVGHHDEDVGLGHETSFWVFTTETQRTRRKDFETL